MSKNIHHEIDQRFASLVKQSFLITYRSASWAMLSFAILQRLYKFSGVCTVQTFHDLVDQSAVPVAGRNLTTVDMLHPAVHARQKRSSNGCVLMMVRLYVPVVSCFGSQKSHPIPSPVRDGGGASITSEIQTRTRFHASLAYSHVRSWRGKRASIS